MVLSVITKRFNKYFSKVEVKYQNMYASRPWIEKITYIAVIVAIIVFLAFDTKNDRRRLLSAAGIIALVLVAFIFSKHRLKINWRQVTWGLVLQFIFGLGILRWKPGRLFFECMGKKVDAFLSFTDRGSSFIYGPLISRKPFLPVSVKLRKASTFLPIHSKNNLPGFHLRIPNPNMNCRTRPQVTCLQFIFNRCLEKIKATSTRAIIPAADNNRRRSFFVSNARNTMIATITAMYVIFSIQGRDAYMC
jgi:hypothetical protein